MVDKIVMLAEARGWDQGELESRAGLARGRISKWKADQGEPSAKQALRMARLLNVSMEYLADDDLDEPAPVPSIALAADERAIIDLYHDLELDKREAVKRLATPLTTPVPWLPGAVRDQTPLLNPKPPARRAAPVDDNDFSDGPHDLRPGYTRPPKPPRKKLGG